MTSDFKECLDKGLIRKSAEVQNLAVRELDLADMDLKAAKQSLKARDAKWATVQAYYSMFHSGRALIYKQGYRERSHKCLLVAVREIYQGKGLSPDLIDAMQEARFLRENADYVGEASQDSAIHLVDAAKKISAAARKIVKKK